MAKKDKEKKGKDKKEKLSGFQVFLSILAYPFKLIFKFLVWLVKTLLKLIIKAPLRIITGLLIVIAFIALIIWLI